MQSYNNIICLCNSKTISFADAMTPHLDSGEAASGWRICVSNGMPIAAKVGCVSRTPCYLRDVKLP